MPIAHCPLPIHEREWTEPWFQNVSRTGLQNIIQHTTIIIIINELLLLYDTWDEKIGIDNHARTTLDRESTKKNIPRNNIRHGGVRFTILFMYWNIFPIGQNVCIHYGNIVNYNGSLLL